MHNVFSVFRVFGRGTRFLHLGDHGRWQFLWQSRPDFRAGSRDSSGVQLEEFFQSSKQGQMEEQDTIIYESVTIRDFAFAQFGT